MKGKTLAVRRIGVWSDDHSLRTKQKQLRKWRHGLSKPTWNDSKSHWRLLSVYPRCQASPLTRGSNCPSYVEKEAVEHGYHKAGHTAAWICGDFSLHQGLLNAGSRGVCVGCTEVNSAVCFLFLILEKLFRFHLRKIYISIHWYASLVCFYLYNLLLPYFIITINIFYLFLL